MTPARFLDICRAASWKLTPDLVQRLDDDEFRSDLCRALSPEVVQEQHAFLLAMMRLEMDYRARLWEGLVEDRDDRYENIYRCAYLLYRLGREDDVFLLWQAKHLDMDVGCSIGVEYFIGAGVDETLRHLAVSENPDAGAIAAYVEGAFVKGDWLPGQSNWERAQFEYYWPA